MKNFVTVITLLITSFSFAQVADSLLLADFEDESRGFAEWSGVFGDGAGVEVVLADDPSDLSAGALEILIDADLGIKGGFANSNLNIIVNGDTASALVAYVWVPESFLKSANGLQIFAQDRVTWNWQSAWYTTSALRPEAWNRLIFDFDERRASVPEYDISNGLQSGVEFVLNEGTDFYDVVNADNIYLLGISGETGVKSRQVVQPGSIKLEQNFPNPFNPTTHIIYHLDQRQTVTVTVFDATGRLVKTLVENEIQPAGRVALQFDAAGLSSGVYFYRIQTAGDMQIKKMVLIR
ncbi:T9SS type A sorting domain-containing protein [candidate division KSB1 bacterium]|nr:T9SS type A sorting domain-containing protein [candidate division KSB1 bacterium]